LCFKQKPKNYETKKNVDIFKNIQVENFGAGGEYFRHASAGAARKSFGSATLQARYNHNNAIFSKRNFPVPFLSSKN
jgi:hypothetical protein